MLRNLFASMRLPGGPSQLSNCEQIQDHLIQYLDRELIGANKVRLETHLSSCAACRAALAACRMAEDALVTAVRTVPSPGDLRGEFYQRLQKSQRRPNGIGWKLAVPALAAGAVVWIFSGLLPHNTVSTTSRTAPTGRATEVVVDPTVANQSEQLNVDALLPKGLAGTMAELIRDGQMHFQNAGADRRARLAHIARPPKTASSRVLARVLRLKVPVLKTDALLSLSARALDRSQMFGLSVARRDTQLSDKAATDFADVRGPDTRREGGGVRLAGLVDETELHVSDEARDFMSSTHIDAGVNRRYKGDEVRVEDESESAPEPVELPALP